MALSSNRLKDFPMDSNPYHHDHFRMGTSIDNIWEVMYEKHRDNDYIIVIDKHTGERFIISRVPIPDSIVSFDPQG